MKNILISAHAFHPFRGSEPYVAWNWVQIAKKYNNVVVVTSYSKEKIRLISELETEIVVKYVKKPFDYEFLKKTLLGRLTSWIFYTIWQIKIYFVCRSLIKQYNIDLIHHLTYNSWITPSFLFLLGKPFIFGPIGGGEFVKTHLYKYLGIKGVIFEILRTFIYSIVRYSPVFLAIKKYSKIILVINEETVNYLKVDKIKTKKMLETAIEPFDQQLSHLRKNENVTLLYVGDLIPIKGVMVLLKSILLVKTKKVWTLDIVGDGPEKKRLIKFAKENGLKNIRFIGRINKNEVKKYYKQSDIFIFPSFRDTSGNVLLEAMNFSLPIISFNYAGPKEIINSDYKYNINIDDLNIEIKIAEAIENLIENRNHRLECGEILKKHLLEKHTWEKREEEIRELYSIS